MDLLWFAIRHDWVVLSPIILCSLIALTVTIERYWYYRTNKVPFDKFVEQLQEELDRGTAPAQALARETGGIIGDVAEEGIDIVATHPQRFERMYEITTSMAARSLEKNLAILSTIATISPYLGLFGTVVRILLTFGSMSQSSTGGNASEIMFGIGSALIATACGLGVAIAAVAFNNYFRRKVDGFLGDFELLKLVFLNAMGPPTTAAQNVSHVPQRTPVPPMPPRVRPDAQDGIRG